MEKQNSTEGLSVKQGHHVQEEKSCDIFLVYSEDDDFRIKKTILPYFERNDIRYHTDSQSGLEAAIVHDAIQSCNKTLLILTKSAERHVTFSLSVMLALEKSIHMNKMHLIVLLMDGVNEDEIPKVPLLKYARHIVVDENIFEKCMEKLVFTIREDVPLQTLLPAGNVATGMAWSHFVGYLRLLLPELATHITESKWFQQYPGHMPVCFYMLLPTTATAPSNIEEVDPNVSYEGSLKINVGNRTLHPSIYKVTDQKNGHKTDYYCCAEYPSALCAFGTISKEVLCQISYQQIQLEVERFYCKLTEIINHDKNRVCNGLAKCILFKDDGKDESSLPSYQLVAAIKEEVKSRLMFTPEQKRLQKKELQSQSDKYKNDVCILYGECDKQVAFHIRTYLEEQGCKVSVGRPGYHGDPITEVEQRILESRWTVILISKETYNCSDWVSIYLAEILSVSFEEQQMKVLPVLLDSGTGNLPDFMRWVTYIDIQQEKNYLNLIYDTVQGINITMTSQIPVGNVAFGLAWAFHVNYLRHVLPDLKERMENGRKQYEKEFRGHQDQSRKVYISYSLFQLMPKSCSYPLYLTEKDNTGRMHGPWEIQEVRKDIGGSVGRVYRCSMYQIQGATADYYFCGEFLSPLKTLKEMCNSRISGLNKEQMYIQARELHSTLQAILNSDANPSKHKDSCKLLYYDDSKEQLSDVIMNAMSNTTTQYR